MKILFFFIFSIKINVVKSTAILLFNYNCFGDPGIAAAPEFKSIGAGFTRTEIDLIGSSIHCLGTRPAGNIFISSDRSG